MSEQERERGLERELKVCCRLHWVTEAIHFVIWPRPRLCVLFMSNFSILCSVFNAARGGLVCLGYLFKMHAVRSICVFIHNL